MNKVAAETAETAEKETNGQEAFLTPTLKSSMIIVLKGISPEIRELTLENYREAGGGIGAFDRKDAKLFLEALIKAEDYVELKKKIKDKKEDITVIRQLLEAFLYP